MQVQSLSQEGPLKKEKATHSSMLAWTFPWTEEHGRLQSIGSLTVRHNLVTKPAPPQASNILLLLIMAHILLSLLLPILISVLFN